MTLREPLVVLELQAETVWVLDAEGARELLEAIPNPAAGAGRRRARRRRPCRPRPRLRQPERGERAEQLPLWKLRGGNFVHHLAPSAHSLQATLAQCLQVKGRPADHSDAARAIADGFLHPQVGQAKFGEARPQTGAVVEQHLHRLLEALHLLGHLLDRKRLLVKESHELQQLVARVGQHAEQ